MSELSTLARPYAEAVFRLAQAESDLAGWSQRIARLAAIVSDAQMARLIADPAVPADRVATLIVEVAGADLGERGANFVRVLADNDRLTVLPEIASQFETLKAQAEGTLEATITSAQELTQAQIDDLVAGLKARFNRAVSVEVAVDPSLIGGAVISIGDQVIDGSVKGRLEKMAFALHG
ncbi:MAG: F0F1 ATP synthase subunit delta [Thiobacillus sp.]|nr:F0F1 ATP synthase subunit delta [Thiobacillus sp.]